MTTSRREESKRFGSRAWARELMAERGQAASSSGRFQRAIERREAAVVVAPKASAGKRRLLPFEIQLMQAGSSEPLFRPGPFDELRVFQRRVDASRRVDAKRHSLEFLTWLSPHDQGSEAYRAYGVFRLEEAEPLVDLRRQQSFWLRLRAEHGLRTLPQARVRGKRTGMDGLPREGRLEIEPRLASGPYQRSGQRDLDQREVCGLMRDHASGFERVAWMEEAFRSEVPRGMALHRYYLDADLSVYLVRQVGLSKTVCVLTASEEARARGLLIYPNRRPLTYEDAA